MRFATVLGLAGVAVCVTLRATPGVAAGGPFSGSYSGTYSHSSCGFRCTATTFSGKGRASFLHGGTESGIVKVNCAIEGCNGIGSATLTSRANPANSITLTLATHYGTWRWTVSSGTGKFAHATGNGEYTSTAGSGNTYDDQWKGTIGY
jgi:hypothetical protein